MRKPIMGPSPYSVRRFAAVTTFAHPLEKYQLIWRRKYLTISLLKIKSKRTKSTSLQNYDGWVSQENKWPAQVKQIACKKKKDQMFLFLMFSNVFVVSITPPSLCMGRISKVGQQIHIFILSFLLNFRLSEIFHRF